MPDSTLVPLPSHPSTQPGGATRHRAQSRRHRRATLRVLLTALLVALGGWAATAPASAATVVTCTGTGTATYSPGLTNTPTAGTYSYTSTYSSCLHVDGLSVTTMTALSTGTVPVPSQSCQSLLRAAPGTEVLTWSDGRTSTLSYTTTVTVVGGNLVYTANGTITAGLYVGASTVQEVTAVVLDGLAACDTPTGLTSLSGPLVLTITGV